MNKLDLKRMTGKELIEIANELNVPVSASNGRLKETKAVVIDRIAAALPKQQRGSRNAAKTKLKSMRVAANMSQSELATATGLNVRTLQHYEQGSKNFDSAHITTLLKVCIALKCDLYDIIQSDEIKELYKQYQSIGKAPE